MAYEVIQSESWQNFKSGVLQTLYDHKPFERGPFLFRGQGSSEYTLISSFDRWFSGPRSQKAPASERLIKLFEQEAEGLPVEREIWKDQTRRLALAQHHGVPTRLLDWSESPYIAAFFAFSGLKNFNPDRTDQVAIWCLDRRKIDIWTPESGVEILHVPSYGNERIRNQIGWFTLLKAPYDTLEQYLDHFSPEEAGGALRQIRVPAYEVRRALGDLELMGISFTRIYPGLDGSAMTATLRARLESSRLP